MKILITGCAGFIGAHLTKNLLEKNHQIVGIDNLNDYYPPQLKNLRLQKLIGKNQNFKFFKKDINDRLFLKKLFKRFSFNTIIHLAAQAGVRYSLVNPQSYEKNNLAGLLSLLEAIKEQKPQPKLIFASSSSVYGSSQEIPFKENNPCNQPTSLYAATKRAGELMIQSYHYLFGLKACILRLFTVYGPWGRPDMAYYQFTEKIFSQQPIIIYGKDTQRDFTYIDDIIFGIESTLDKSFSFEIINLGHSQPVNLIKFLKILEKEVGKKAIFKIKKLPKTDLKITYAHIDKARKLLNWQPKTSLSEGLKKFVQWYKTQIKKIN